MKKYCFLLTIPFIFNSCAERTYVGEQIYNKPHFTSQQYSKIIQRPTIFMDLNSAITELSNQILINNIVNQREKKLVLTTFVNLGELKKTSIFGRVASESMINELHIRNFQILDFRGQDNISIDNNGEYHISREVNKIKKQVKNAYILVGTYSLFDQNSIAINARIMKFETGEVSSSGRVIYSMSNCKLFDLCDENRSKIEMIKG